MAPSVSNSKPRQNAKKPLIKPVLPALPILAKGPKAKAEPEQAPALEPSSDGASSNGERLESSGNIEVVEASDHAGDQGDKLQPVSESFITKGAGARSPEAAQESEGDTHNLEAGETPAQPPTGHATESIDANEQSAATEVSSYHDGTAQSNISAVSAEDSFQHSLSVQDNTGHESRPWSDETNDTSQPSCFGHDTTAGAQANGSPYTKGSDFSKAALPDSYENGAEPTNYERHMQTPHTTVGLVNGNGPDLQSEAASQQHSVATNGPHIRSDSLATSPLPSISDHLLQLSTSKMWADWVFMVHTSGLQPFAAYAHGMLLTRSTCLTNLMNRQAAAHHNGNIINLYPPRIIIPHAFEAALRFFYSDTVLSSEILSSSQPATDNQTMRSNLLDYLLSYWVSGIELGAEPIVTRSAHLLVEFMNWDVTESVMKEAIELDSMSWRASDQRAGFALNYAAMALQLKQTVLNFLATQISLEEFKFDTSASTSMVRSRFAHIEDSRARPNPVLSSMVFGSMPSSADLSPSSPQSEILPTITSVEDQAASHILLNVDFDELAFFYRQLEATHGTVARPFIKKVVDERESRRLKVVSNRAVPNKQRMTNSEKWDVAGYREHLHDGVLRRERMGFLLPTKSR